MTIVTAALQEEEIQVIVAVGHRQLDVKGRGEAVRIPADAREGGGHRTVGVEAESGDGSGVGGAPIGNEVRPIGIVGPDAERVARPGRVAQPDVAVGIRDLVSREVDPQRDVEGEGYVDERTAHVITGRRSVGGDGLYPVGRTAGRDGILEARYVSSQLENQLVVPVDVVARRVAAAWRVPGDGGFSADGFAGEPAGAAAEFRVVTGVVLRCDDLEALQDGVPVGYSRAGRAGQHADGEGAVLDNRDE